MLNEAFHSKGVCEKQVQDLVERFWDIIENISPSDLGENKSPCTLFDFHCSLPFSFFAVSSPLHASQHSGNYYSSVSGHLDSC